MIDSESWGSTRSRIVSSSRLDPSIKDDKFVHVSMSSFDFENSPFLYPQRRISIFKSWMEFLNLTLISLSDNSSITAVSRYLSSLYLLRDRQSGTQEVAKMWSVFLALGLSSVGQLSDTQGIYQFKLKVLDFLI